MSKYISILYQVCTVKKIPKYESHTWKKADPCMTWSQEFYYSVHTCQPQLYPFLVAEFSHLQAVQPLYKKQTKFNSLE